MNLIYAYPWDVIGDPDAPARLRDLGVDGVALAAAYHSVRAATPLHPRHRIVDARHAALYVPVRPSAWNGLTPAAPSWVPEDSFGIARDALRAVGLTVHAWTVFTHNTLLGTACPELTVRNAFGDRYAYALCPSSPAVVDYCTTLLREVVELGAADGLILEATGPLGARHAGHHEKTAGADWSAVQTDLLSLCFCTACAARYASSGLSVDELATRVRTGVAEAAPSMAAALGPMAEAVKRTRLELAGNLRTLLVREARPGMHVSMFACPDPWATGPEAPVVEPAEVDALITGCWGTRDDDVAALRGLAGLGRVGSYVLTLPPRPADGVYLAELLRSYAEAGAEDFHFYHGGLSSAARLSAVRQALAASVRS